MLGQASNKGSGDKPPYIFQTFEIAIVLLFFVLHLKIVNKKNLNSLCFQILDNL